MEPGFVVRSRTIKAVDAVMAKQGEVMAVMHSSFAAPKKEHFVFIYLGCEVAGTPLTKEQVEERLNAIGWKRMNAEEQKAFDAASKAKYDKLCGVE